MLPGLEPLVNYCVEVEILYLNNTSQTSNITCLTNTPSSKQTSLYLYICTVDAACLYIYVCGVVHIY